MTQNAEFGPGGAFSTTFDTANLDASGTPYTVTYAYAGDPNLSAGKGDELADSGSVDADGERGKLNRIKHGAGGDGCRDRRHSAFAARWRWTFVKLLQRDIHQRVSAQSPHAALRRAD